MERWEFEDGTRFEATPVSAGSRCQECDEPAVENIHCEFTHNGERHQWGATVCEPCGALLTIPGRPEGANG